MSGTEQKKPRGRKRPIRPKPRATGPHENSGLMLSDAEWSELTPTERAYKTLDMLMRCGVPQVMLGAVRELLLRTEGKPYQNMYVHGDTDDSHGGHFVVRFEHPSKSHQLGTDEDGDEQSGENYDDDDNRA